MSHFIFREVYLSISHINGGLSNSVSFTGLNLGDGCCGRPPLFTALDIALSVVKWVSLGSIPAIELMDLLLFS